MNNNKFLKTVVVLVALVAAAYLAAGLMLSREDRGAPKEEIALKGSEGATSIIQNFQHIESHLDKIGWELSAGKAELLENLARLYAIKMRFYTPAKEIIYLAGDSGTIDLSNKNIQVKGNVTAAFNDTYYFYTDEVTWNSDQKRLSSPGPVRIVGPQGEITGTALSAHPYEKRFLLEGGVTVDFKGKVKNPFSIRGEHS